MSSDEEPVMKVEESDSESEETLNDLTNTDILTKYRLAADIANRTLTGVIAQCVAGKKVVDICAMGDSLIVQQCARSFKSKKIEKGIAFPTCVSVNECVCHYSPLPAESIELKDGDIVKIDLGCHIDGYIAVLAHTLVVGATEVTGEEADVITAAYTAVNAAFKLARVGNKASEVIAMFDKVAEDFGVSSVEGTLSHNMRRFVIDGENVLVQKEFKDQKTFKDFEFEANQVYALDVAYSTGEGKVREAEDRTTVFKRAVDQSYRLKMKASRYVINEVNKNFATLPFSIRSFGDEKQARLGVTECVKHELLSPYDVLYERTEGAKVGHFKVTVLVAENGTTKITGTDLPDSVTSEKTPSEEVKAILARASKKKKKRGKKKKKAATAAAAAPAAAGQ